MTLSATPKVLLFAREAGGVEAIRPLIPLLRQANIEVQVASRDAGLTRWGDDENIVELSAHAPFGIQPPWPQAICTSAASLPELDMTERRLWQWAQEMGIPSVAVLDQWQNYGVRFSGESSGQELLYLPSICCVMDDHARSGMIDAGFPPGRIRITGQPAFDQLITLGQNHTQESQRALREKLGLDAALTTIVFVSEYLREHWGDSYGYDEVSTLRALLEITRTFPNPLQILVKLHPENHESDFATLLDDFSDYQHGITFVGTTLSGREAVLAADLVVGMSSVLLFESILLGLPTMSMQLGARRKDLCAAVNLGAIPLICSIAEARAAMAQVLFEETRRLDWLDTQMSIKQEPDAAQRVVRTILSSIQGEVELCARSK